MRLLKVLTILLALSSVITLVLASRATPRRLTSISAVQPAMNFGYVRIEGVAPAYPTLSDKDRFMSFRVLDASGEIRVTGYRAVVEQLLAQGRVPMPGDIVSVEGTLRVRDDEPSLVLNMPEALTIERPAATPIQLSALSAMQLGERVQTVGQVRRIRDVSDALRVVSLRDGNATSDMLLPLDLPAFGAAPELRIGDWISITGAVGEYRGVQQVLPSNSQSVTRIGASTSVRNDLRSVGALNADSIGQWVDVAGQVSDLRPFKQGMRVDVTDESGATIVVVLFDSVWQALPFSTTLSVDDSILVQGEVAEYRGQLEILPELPVDVQVTSGE